MSLSTIPPELKIMIAKLLPQKTLKNLALTEKLWEEPARVVLYRYLDLMDKDVLEKWLDVKRDKFFEHVRTLFCWAKLGIKLKCDPENQMNVDRFLESHLQQFPKLSYLTLHSGPIPPTLSQSLANETLKFFKLNGCSISLNKLVTLLNYFRYLEHLSLCNTVTESNAVHPHEQPPRLLYYPKKLTLAGVENETLEKFSKLSKDYKQLTFELSLDSPTAVQNFINRSTESLEYLELRYDVIDSDSFPTFSECSNLHKVAVDNRILQSDHAENFISWISSSKLREITIFNVVDPSRRCKEGVEGALCELAKTSDITVKVYLIRHRLRPVIGMFSHPDDAKVWFNRHPDGEMGYLTIHSYDCTIEFQNYLPELRKDCRVVLMEEREKGTVVVHDSRDPSIHCDCGRDTGTGEGLPR